MNFDSNFLKINLSQFFIFWKNILIQNYTSSENLDYAFFKQSFQNLMLRNLSLTCLLNFLRNFVLTPELSKQVQFLLTKSLNFITSFETSLNKFKLSLRRNSSTSSLNQTLSFINSTINLDTILLNKIRIYQCYLALASFIKNDVNSNILISALSNFSNPEIYNHSNIEFLIPNKNSNLARSNSVKSKTDPNNISTKHEIQDNLDNNDLLLANDGVFYGLTSKYYFSRIPDLSVKFPLNKKDSEKPLTSDDFAELVNNSTNMKSKADYLLFEDSKYDDIDHISIPPDSIESNFVKSHFSDLTWIDTFENNILFRPFSPQSFHDPFLLIYDDSYSGVDKYSSGLTTQLIDLSIEVFILFFSSLPSQIQQSLLEQLRSNILSKKSLFLRYKAIVINSFITIHGILLRFQKNNMKLDGQIFITLMEMLSRIDVKEKYLVQLKSDSIGLVTSLASDKNLISEQVQIFVKNIVDKNEPYSRSTNLLILSSIYKHSSANFNQIMDLLLTLVIDSHPVVNFWALDCLVTVLDSRSTIPNGLCIRILQILERIYIDDSYNLNTSSLSTFNLSIKFNSRQVISRLLRSLILSIGPGIIELQYDSKIILRNLIMSSLFLENDLTVQRELISAILNLLIFENSIVSPEKGFKIFELSFFKELLKFHLKNNLYYMSIGTISLSISIPFWNLAEENNEIFLITTSYQNLSLTISCYFELIKMLDIDEVLAPEVKRLLWICVDMKASFSKLLELFKMWMESSLSANWFVLLSSLFKIEKGKLYNEIFSSYKSILTKYDKKEIKVEIKDEEVQSMANAAEESESEDNNSKQKNNDAEEDRHSNGRRGSRRQSRASFESLNETTVEYDPIDWRFKAFVLELLRYLLTFIKTNPGLFNDLAKKISDLIKISFGASTSSVIELRIIGINLLGDIITIYSNIMDPLYPTIPLLEQQQAQIISALTPAFSQDSSTILASEAINVCAKFIGSGISSLSKLERILNILVNSLEEFSGHGDMKIGDVQVLTNQGKKRMKLFILNAWAELKICANNFNSGKDFKEYNKSNEPDEVGSNELNRLINEHYDILVPMWILSLREFATLKYGGGFEEISDKRVELFLYESCWINFVDVIGCIIEEKEEFIFELLKNDIGNFFFILYAQCIELLIKPSSYLYSKSLLSTTSKSNNHIRILIALNKLLHSKISSHVIFQDLIFSETIDLFNRLILVSEDKEKIIIVDLVSGLFSSYFNGKENTEDFNSDIDKLFELLRIVMISIGSILPFISNDERKEGEQEGEEERQIELSHDKLLILKNSFNSISMMINKFPKLIRIDLISCLLYILTTIYSRKLKQRNEIIPIILPTLKTLLIGLINDGCYSIISDFYNVLSGLIGDDKNSFLTLMVLITTCSKYFEINEENSKLMVKTLSEWILGKETLAFAIQSIKSLIISSVKENGGSAGIVVKRLLPTLLEILLEDEGGKIEEPRLIIEMFVLLAKTLNNSKNEENKKNVESKLISIYSIIIPLFCWFDKNSKISSKSLRVYFHNKLIELVTMNSETFKIVVNEVLSAEQRQETEKLVKFDVNDRDNSSSDDGESEKQQQQHIQLKMFDSN
ncbi:AP-1 complex accessory protein LAA1 ASCRUDRAFT_78189 [Ascoidea rubescens DSM 1968]|uniref:LAA1-like C-terminal TPR repeats domain-containing protein n=1 Tax=Ascoidea rubescens DSM 1968 TaxID=1344418 RepID=A0A1D2V8V7_9ASCO|nr:hypothetical protein ASCRUDRAFT_78189 [Ascoidea rubescens DSM 1968]ODV58070.1 hypothetical protein ASCRUDRAFT_78189 [Ascoidea rubescens DSM 1968]